jgi:hypothetical protein
MGRTSNWKRQHVADEDFTRAAWDTLVDLERSFSVQVTISITPSTQRGVWVLWMAAHSRRKGEDNRQVARYQSSYPNGTAAALSSYLFACMSSFYLQVAAAAEEEWRALCDLRETKV